MSEQRSVSVYAKKQADKVKKETKDGFTRVFDKSTARVVRDKMVMLDDVAENYNKDFAKTGLFYVKNEAATKARLDELEKQKAGKAESDK